MKTFKDLINEVQEPLSQGEKNFKKLHIPVNHKDLVPGVTDQDHVFNGTPQRKDPKTASYEEDASEKAYDKTLKIKDSEEKKKGTQTDLNMEEEASLDEKTLTPAEMRKREEIVKSLKRKGMEKSKAYAIATATAKRVAEENLDELSKQTLGSYINKAASSAAKSSYKIMKDKPENAAKHGMDSYKRLEGIKKATAKMAEEAEQIDELSSKTMMNYGIKATAEIGKGNLSTDKESKRMAGTKMADEKMRKKEGKSSMAKIAAEEVEHDNEEDRDDHFEKQSKKMQDAINLHLRRGKSYDEAVKAAKKHVKEELELDEARRGRPRKDGSKPAGDEEGGREHIIVQLRKVVNLRGQKHVEFNDNSKHEVGVEHAKKALATHDSMKRAEDKHNYASQLAKSHSAFKDAVSGKIHKPEKKGISLAKLREAANIATLRADRGPMTTAAVRQPDGTLDVVSRKPSRKEIQVGESEDLNKANVDKAVKHDCAKHVVHETWGKGETVEGMHTIVETAEGEGYVTHYDVMFKHGIERDVPVEDLQIVTMVEHWHKDYKPKSKMKEGKEHTVPKTAREKELAAKGHPKDKITHKDVLIARGVVKETSANMQTDSLNKLKKDPSAGENIKSNLPPTQGNKAVGGEGDPSRVGGKYSVEESVESLNKLYDSLSEDNKAIFDALIETESGAMKLLTFAREQGF